MAFKFSHPIFFYAVLASATIVIPVQGMEEALMPYENKYGCPYSTCSFATNSLDTAKLHILSHTQVEIKCTLCASSDQDAPIKENGIKRLGKIILSRGRPKKVQEGVLPNQTYSFAGFVKHWKSRHATFQTPVDKYLLGQYPDWRILTWVEEDAAKLKDKAAITLPDIRESTFSLSLNRSMRNQ